MQKSYFLSVPNPQNDVFVRSKNLKANDGKGEGKWVCSALRAKDIQGFGSLMRVAWIH